MKLKLFGMALLFSVLNMSCKDELSDSIDRKMKDNESKVEKAEQLNPAAESRERKDKDWDISVGH